MKRSKFYYPAHKAIAEGVTFNAADDRQIREMAKILSLLDRHTLAAMVDGLGREAAAMKDIEEFTREGSDEEAFRTLRIETALIARAAARMAAARLD